MRMRLLSIMLVLSLGCASAYAQSATRDSGTRKEGQAWRTWGLVGGIVGGLLVGFAVSDDDAVDAEKKLARNMAIGAVAGGVAGYFAGRAVDRKKYRSSALDPLLRERIQRRLREQEKAFMESALARWEKASEADRVASVK